jgi:hypothetical protein
VKNSSWLLALGSHQQKANSQEQSFELLCDLCAFAVGILLRYRGKK